MMNRQQWQGNLTRTMGSWKESIGRMTGDRDLEAEGAARKAAGEALLRAGNTTHGTRVDDEVPQRQN
jgi:uncharacterized protein YjbJ (UPF0337 family)